VRKMVAAVLAAFLVMVPTLVAANVRIDRLTNNYRVTYNLNRLKSADHDNTLWVLARKRTYQIERNFAHRSDWQWFFNRLPSCARGIGENIAYYRGWGSLPYHWPFSAWRSSPEHRDNILGQWAWQASAVRSVVRSDGSRAYYAVQLFLRGCKYRRTL